MIVTEETLRETTLQLLASSTSKRYIREARRIATECGLVDRIRNDADQYAQARTRATELLEQLDGQRTRSRVEFELAILLCALSGTGSEDSAETLRQASQTSCPWIRALAGRLSLLGPPTLDELQELRKLKTLLLATAPDGGIVNATPLHASDRQNRRKFPRVA